MSRTQAKDHRELSDIQLESITLVHANFERAHHVVPGGRNVRIEIGSEFSTEDPSAAVSRCKVSLETKSEDEKPPMVVESAYRVVFSSETVDLEVDEIQAHLAALAMRVGYPYHRQIIGQMISQSGLPPLLLPLVPDDQWVVNMAEKSEQALDA
jgi:preprotein translocase subunit SecB